MIALLIVTLIFPILFALAVFLVRRHRSGRETQWDDPQPVDIEDIIRAHGGEG